MANIEAFIKCVELRDERELPHAIKPKYIFPKLWRFVVFALVGKKQYILEDLEEYDSKDEARTAARNYCNGITIKKIQIIKVG